MLRGPAAPLREADFHGDLSRKSSAVSGGVPGTPKCARTCASCTIVGSRMPTMDRAARDGTHHLHAFPDVATAERLRDPDHVVVDVLRRCRPAACAPPQASARRKALHRAHEAHRGLGGNGATNTKFSGLGAPSQGLCGVVNRRHGIVVSSAMRVVFLARSIP